MIPRKREKCFHVGSQRRQISILSNLLFPCIDAFSGHWLSLPSTAFPVSGKFSQRSSASKILSSLWDRKPALLKSLGLQPVGKKRWASRPLILVPNSNDSSRNKDHRFRSVLVIYTFVSGVTVDGRKIIWKRSVVSQCLERYWNRQNWWFYIRRSQKFPKNIRCLPLPSTAFHCLPHTF